MVNETLFMVPSNQAIARQLTRERGKPHEFLSDENRLLFKPNGPGPRGHWRQLLDILIRAQPVFPSCEGIRFRFQFSSPWPYKTRKPSFWLGKKKEEVGKKGGKQTDSQHKILNRSCGSPFLYKLILLVSYTDSAVLCPPGMGLAGRGLGFEEFSGILHKFVYIF